MPRTSAATKPGTRKLSEVAKHLSVPSGIVSTGWPDVERTCRVKLGVDFDPWQDGAGRLILAKRADGHLAAMVDGVGLSLPRQVGKTYLVGALVFALCVNTPGLLVIWSAHHARTHGETFLSMQGFAQRVKVAPFVKQVFTGSGDEEIRFHNGSRILFGARERGFGRGIPGVDVLIFDEAQILSDRAMANMLATMNTSQFGLQLYIGTPPKPTDDSEAFTRMRKEALAKTLVDGAWIELGADDDADGNDRKQWAKANPSYLTRTPAQSLLRLKRKLTDADWRREGLGIWDEFDSATVVPLSGWRNCADPKGTRGQIADDAPIAVAVDVSWDRQWAYVAVAGPRADGVPRAVVRHKCEPWKAVDYIVELASERTVLGVALQGSGAPVSSLLPHLERELEPLNIPVRAMNGPDMQRALGIAHDLVLAEGVSHAGQDVVDDAVPVAVARETTDGGRLLDRRKSRTDIAGLAAWVHALWLNQTHVAEAVPELFIVT